MQGALKFDVVVVGAGPAGLNAAKYAANSGCTVALIDAGARLGGQYWRHSGDETFDNSVHHNFDAGTLLMDAVRANPRITIFSSTSIWSASIVDSSVHLRAKGSLFTTRKLILATGAYDRALPFPGWDLPGVMTAGAAQALLKGSQTLAGKRVVVAGTGPFLLPVASGLAENGAEKVWLCEANSPLKWLKKAHLLLQNPQKIADAVTYFLSLKRKEVEVGYREAVVKATANNDGELAAVTIAKLNGRGEVISTREVECDVAAVSWGFTPDVALATSLGVEATVGVDGAVYIPTDSEQCALNTAAENSEGYQIYCAGELAGVGGSDLALVEGAIAGLAAAGKRPNRQLLSLRKKRRRFADALLAIYPVVSGWRNWLEAETTICRCEEITHADFMSAHADLGATDVRTMKLMTRTGMGMCQGRVCARNICDLLASSDEERIKATGRPIISPITLGELAEEGLL